MSEQKYKKLSAYGLIADLRIAVGNRRKSKKKPSRDTVWRAYHQHNGKGLHNLIMEMGDALLVKHENEVEGVAEAVPMAAQT